MKEKIFQWLLVLTLPITLALLSSFHPVPAQALPAAPTLTSPLNNSIPSGNSATFTWEAVAGATNYRIQISTSASFPSPYFHYNTTAGATNKTYTDFPNDGTVFYWRVQAYDASGWGTWSTVWSFTSGVPKYNPNQVALLRWYGVNQSGAKFSVGGNPERICFDGASIWVTNYNGGNVTKLKASDGTVLGTYTVGTGPVGICFDGASIWVTNYNGGNVTKLRASDGIVLGTYTAGSSPYDICFDGANIWVTNQHSNTVTKRKASDGTAQGTYAVGASPMGICFDGTNIWVANYYGNTVTKLRAGDGNTLGMYSVGLDPVGICFDGANIWVANYGSNNVTKLRAKDGSTLGTYRVGTTPGGICFDGTNIWVTNPRSNTVSKL